MHAKKDSERLAALRPIDDEFMRGLFNNNLPLAQLVVRIITGKPDLILKESVTQADMKRVTGARSICLDVYGTDESGKKYDIEIQRADRGAEPHRARYHSSVLDIENLEAGQNFTELPDTYIIFITEKDFFGTGAPVYKIENVNLTTGEPFNDGARILYVNGEYRGDDDIGKLMHDFNCSNANDMRIGLLAERTRYLKETEKGGLQLSRIGDEIRYEYALEIAENLIKMKVLSYEEIAEATNIPLETIQELAGQLAG